MNFGDDAQGEEEITNGFRQLKRKMRMKFCEIWLSSTLNADFNMDILNNSNE